MEVYDSSSHQTGRGNLHDHHNGHLKVHTVHWHIEVVHVNTAPLLKDHNTDFKHMVQNLFKKKKKKVLTTASLICAI